MTYEKIFSDIQKNFKKAKLSDFTREFAFQFNITGEGEGIFYAAYKNGVLSIEPYDYKDRDVIFTADGKTLTAIAAGKLEPIYAINDGKLSVDGNEELAKELMLLINHEKKTETKTAAKSAPSKKETKPEVKTEVKTEVKEEKPKESENKQETKQVKTETAVKTEEKPVAAAEAKAPVKTVEKKPASASKAPAKAKTKKAKRK